MARFIGVVSGKGGVGKTTVVSNFAYALSRLGRSVITVDCNVTTPHLSDYIPDFNMHTTINDVIKGNANIFSALHYNQGIYVVPASRNLDDLVGLDISNLPNVLQHLNNTDNIIILDSAPGLGKEALSVLKSCNEILFVTTPQRPAVNDILRCIKVSEKLGINNIGIILNMHKKKGYNLQKKEIENITGVKVIGTIPYEEKIAQSVSEKKPLVKFWPNTTASDEIMKIAANFLGVPYKRQGRLKRFFTSFLGSKYTPKVSNKLAVYTTIDNKTVGDRILDMIAVNRKITINELAKVINVNAEEIYKWGKIFHEQNILTLQPSIFGIKKTKLIQNG